MQERHNLWQTLYQNLGSLKLTVFVFFTLATASLIGTLLPQGMTENELLHRQYSPGIARLIEALGLNDLYHTGWFRFLLVLLCMNLIICTLQRLPKTLKLLKHSEDSVNPQKLVKFSASRQFTTRLSWEETTARLRSLISEEFGAVRPIEAGEAYAAISEKGRWSRLMVYVVHLSVLVILLGAIIGSLFGFKGFMNISEGEASGDVILSDGKSSIALPFQVRCDKFEASFYDTGAPKEYRSDLTITDDGQEVLKQSIRVNDPLSYEGVTFYQASYGSTLRQVDVEFQDTGSGQSHRMTLPFREIRSIPGTTDKVQVVEYQQDFSRFGPAVGIALQREGQEPAGSWILVNRPDFHGNRILNYHIKVIRADQIPYTGLQVKRDPGVWVVWFGFVALLTGIGLTFYTSHSKLWVWAERNESARPSVKILLAGRASKNSLAFEKDFNLLCDQLDDALKSDKKRNRSDAK